MTSHGNKRKAFTLVELLIVITIIGMLAGLLIPAVNYAREAARRTQCINHQRNLVQAMTTHATTEGALPGSLNQLGKYKNVWQDYNVIDVKDTNNDPAPRVFSWVVALLPYIEENTRYEVLMEDTPTGARVLQALTRIPVLFCPTARLDSFTSETFTAAAPSFPRLSYVVNCGPEVNSGPTTATPRIDGHTAPAFTVFRDRRSQLTSINKKFKLEDIQDGASNTVLLSENMQTWTWYLPNSATTANNCWSDVDEFSFTSGSNSINTRSGPVVASLGFVWSNISTLTTPTFYSKINEKFADGPLMSPQSTTLYARPSSMHPGLVVMAYADGTARTMNDDVGRGLYLKAVCPNDRQAENNTSTHTTPGNGLGYVNADFYKETW